MIALECFFLSFSVTCLALLFLHMPCLFCTDSCTPPPSTETEPTVTDPCRPSPCGPYSTCRNSNGRGACSCLPDYVGYPPNCRPECVVNTDCQSIHACLGEKCRDPCDDHCGDNALCRVSSHVPVCECLPGYEGDPFDQCRRKPPSSKRHSGSAAIQKCTYSSLIIPIQTRTIHAKVVYSIQST